MRLVLLFDNLSLQATRLQPEILWNGLEMMQVDCTDVTKSRCGGMVKVLDCHQGNPGSSPYSATEALGTLEWSLFPKLVQMAPVVVGKKQNEGILCTIPWPPERKIRCNK